MKNRDLFFTVLETGKAKIKGYHWQGIFCTEL
jgi:hypothetical protein